MKQLTAIGVNLEVLDLRVHENKVPWTDLSCGPKSMQSVVLGVWTWGIWAKDHDDTKTPKNT